MEDILLEKIDMIRARTGVTYREAKEALEQHDGNVVETLIALEEKKDEGSWTEEFSVRSAEVVDRVKTIIHEGNVTKIRVKHDEKILVEIPVTLGAIGAVFLPQLAVLGVIVAVFKRCTIEVIRKNGVTDVVETEDERQTEITEDLESNENKIL